MQTEEERFAELLAKRDAGTLTRDEGCELDWHEYDRRQDREFSEVLLAHYLGTGQYDAVSRCPSDVHGRL